ncbi:MAG: VCBS repeat-containing protein [Planctomycetota bacterium]
MPAVVRRLQLLAPVVLLLIAGCGAGAISAAVFGSKRNNGGATQVTLTVSPGSGPIAVTSGTLLLRTAVLRGRRIPTGADPELRLSWNDGGTVVEDVQLLGRIDTTAEEVSIDFALTTTNIAARAGDPRARDLDVEILALGRFQNGSSELLARSPYRLLRQPALALVPNRPDLGATLVPVSGGDIEMTVDDLPTDDARDLTVEVVTLDPNPPVGSDPRNPPVIRSQATNLRTAPDATIANRTRLLCTAPPATVANAAFVLVRHSLGGLTNAIGDVYYQAELTAVVARRASTRGGDLLTLTGRALVPLDFSAFPPRPDIGRIQLFVSRGDRSVAVPPSDLRPALSTVNSIVFVAPPSPDGRPGPAQVQLVSQFLIPITTTADGLLAYGSASADLGPRGIGLARDVAAAAFARRDVTNLDRAADAAVVFSDSSGVPFVQVLEGRGNGMFSTLGVETIAGDRTDADQRQPLDLAWGEFQGDGLSDLFVLVAGVSRAAHTVLRGIADPGHPLGSSALAFRTLVHPSRVLVTNLDGNGLDDLLLAGREQADRTTETARATIGGGFVDDRVFTSAVASIETETVADLDGDGVSDLVFVTAGPAAKLRLAFGDGVGAFPDRREIDLSGWPNIATSVAVGVHAVGPRPDRTLAIVFAETGLNHAIVVLAPIATRDYGAAPTSIPIGASDPVATLAADLDGDASEELVIARRGASPSLHSWQGGVFVESPGAVRMPASDVGDVVSLHFCRATDTLRGARDAVCVLHRTAALRTDPVRITTLIVGPGPVLEDARAERALMAPARKVVLWASSIGASACDIAIATDDEIDLFVNDGLGSATPSATHPMLGLIESSLCACGSGTGPATRLAFLLEDGHVGQIDPGSAPVFSPTSLLQGLGTLRADSHLVAGDVDGDGVTDLVVLVAVDRQGGAVDRQLVLLRGTTSGLDPFAWELPDPSAWTAISAEVSDLVLGDFAPADPAHHREVALAVPRTDPAHGVRFYRYLEGAASDVFGLVSSVVGANDPVVAADLDPRLLRVADVDADGFDDLLVASRSLDLLTVFRQTGISARTAAIPQEIDPLVFARTADLSLPAGEPGALQLADLDGDLLPDVVVEVRRRSAPDQHAVLVASSNGLAGFVRSFELPAIDVGWSGPDLSASVGDLNGDGQLDLALAWSGDGGTHPSLLRALFGVHR